MDKIDKLLKRLKGNNLSSFGIRAKSELEFMKKEGIEKKQLRFIEEVINEHY